MNTRRIPHCWLSHAAVFALLAGAVSVKADYSSTVTGLNPLAYYRLNESVSVPAADWATNSGSAGLAGYGYYVGAATHPENGLLVAQPNDGAGGFSGGRVSIPYNPALNPKSAFTVECWAMKYTGSGYPLGVFSALYYVGGGERAGWLIYDNDGNWNFRMGDMGGYVVNILGGTAALNTVYHLAATFDGTTAIFYVNGAEVARGTPSRPYSGNPSWPTEIGSASAFGRNFSGVVDEAAIYPTALPASEILAHYQNGISPAPSKPYEQLVLAQNPVGYWRLNEPVYMPPDPSTLPAAANTGSLGAAAKGTIYPGTFTGVAGPPFSGMGGGNTAFQFSGSGGNVGLANPDGLNSLNAITMMAWVKSDGSAGLRNIISHGYVQNPNQELFFRINAGQYQAGSWETGGTVSSAPGLAASDVGQWVLLTATYDGTTWKLYRYDDLIASSVGGGWTAMTADWSVGSRGDNTSDQRYFGGVIDEPAIFGRALTQSEIQQILWSGNVPPIITTQPQAPSGQIIAGAPVSVPVSVSGSPTITYQWMRSGTNVPGQNTAVLTFPNITTNDAGGYVVVAQNPYGYATSSIVTLNVTYPTAPAALASAIGYPVYDPVTHVASLTQVILNFTGPLAAAGSDPAHYNIPGLGVSGARFTNLNTTVVLTTGPQTQGAAYTVTVTGVTDGVGNPLSVNTAQFKAWVSSPANGIYYEYYDGISGVDITNLQQAVLFPDSPTTTTNLWAFDSRIILPDNTVNNYGVRMRGLFIPPVSGKWLFFLRSDDGSAVYLNPNGPEEAGKQLILHETSCCGDWNKVLAYNAGSISLVAGQPYYIEMLYKEGGGDDYGKVAARLEGTGDPVLGTSNLIIDPESLNGPIIAWPYAPADAGGAITVAGPTSASVQANHPVLFTATASNPSGLPMAYQWRRNGQAITGATGSSYGFVATSADNAARFSVRITKVGSDLTTPDAVLTVTSDTDAPTVAAVSGSIFLNRIVVSFNELMGTPDPASYTVPGFTTTGAVLDATGTNVTVSFNNELLPGQTYSLTVKNAADATGTVLGTATMPFETFFFSRGLLRFDYWGHLSQTDNSLDGTLLVDPRFPDSPEWTGFLVGFDTRSVFPYDNNEGYGARITGLFVPPTTGKYAFFIKSDDSSRLYFNPDGDLPLDITTAMPLLEETACCGSFSKIGITNALDSVAGQKYFIEGLLKEGTGGDYMQAATKLETDPTLPDALLPIPAPYVGVLADPVGASVTITEQPKGVIANWLGAGDAQEVLLNANFNTTDGGFTVNNYGVPVGPWSWDAAAGSWTNHGQPNGGCGGPFASGLRSPVITMAKDGGVSVTFAHRYSFEGLTPTDGTPWDGGQVRLSVNGGPFATVAAANFIQNGYISQIGGNVISDLTSTPGWINIAFAGESPGYNGRTFLTSVASLGNFKVGDKIQIEFVASWDDCSEAQEPNWEIDSVQLSLGSAAPVAVNLSVAAESTYKNEPNSYMAYIWQKDSGSGFQDILTASGPTLNLILGLEHGTANYRCIVYGPGAAATSAVATVTVTVSLALESMTANSLTFVWPRAPQPMPITTFVLEKSSTVSGGTWTAVPSDTYVATVGKVRATVSLPPAGSSAFYRLRKQ